MGFFNLIVYRYLKTFIIMAKFELKFIDYFNQNGFIKCEFTDYEDGEDFIMISGECEDGTFDIFLDKSTAIKFAKTLRTEINKITESEVNNG